MNRLALVGISLVVGAELIALMLAAHRIVAWVAAAMAVIVLLAVRRRLAARGPLSVEPTVNEAEESLRDWIVRTQTLIQWSETTRGDWDQHLRPTLAREFFMATGPQQARDPAAMQVTGRMVFGDQLWQWVDPHNVLRSARGEPGPGRATLDDILHRLERL
ncbi:hypothetical protein BOO86_05525 [Mycobacterium sp. CBMA 234]|uniref:hypothetical protein n=1 Tax=Mycolicibacterium sp. CBMA 234 TaxID=1918495 RepID=UPI0012DDF1E1|nr:hypothetical protein [Mycolicibacterium sp. CBMA 234]MUL63918.1 hypothetical protein [Mycolicibacterium sp. CBMA 234]